MESESESGMNDDNHAQKPTEPIAVQLIAIFSIGKTAANLHNSK
jgi:hypothetical protein